MKAIKLTVLLLSHRKHIAFLFIAVLAVFSLVITPSAQPPGDPDLNVLRLGLGDGTVTSDAANPGINCGIDCDQGYAGTAIVTLTAAASSGSTFVGWGGFCAPSGASLSCPNVPMTEARAVTAEFRLNEPIPNLTIAELNPEGIRAYLSNPDAAHQAVNTPARFVAALPDDLQQNWILMSRSESLQTGTARSPRILFISADARNVFTVGMIPSTSYPGSSPLAVEYMQWDGGEFNFRFHEIVLAHIDPITVTPPFGSPMEVIGARDRSISIDDEKCSKCHSTRNVLNVVRPITTSPPTRGATPGTDGVAPTNVGYKNKPNWDAYDSWGGALPFNRDRIYQGSVEAAAFRHLFNLWNWRNTVENDSVRPILEQLSPLGLDQLQPSTVAFTSPHSIQRFINSVTDDQHIRFGFDSLSLIPSETDVPPPPAGSYFFRNTQTEYSFGDPAVAASTVIQNGRYVTLRHSNPSPAVTAANDGYLSPGSDEGRGVELFDRLTGFNATRISEELIAHQFATGSLPINVRPIALAISAGCVNTPDDLAPVLTPIRQILDARNGFSRPEPRLNATLDSRTRITTFAGLEGDTLERRHDLPRRKADIQKRNLDRTNDPYLAAPTDGMIQYTAGTSVPPAVPDVSTSRVRQEVFRRFVDLGGSATTVPALPGMAGMYVDREAYGTNQIALFRYFLEPLGVSVDKWSMSVRGRSRSYNFADLFGTYISRFNDRVGNSYLGHLATSADCTQLINDSRTELGRLPLPPRVDALPTYTDVQRVFNKSCIECHNGLGYPPYNVPFDASYLDFSENENPATGSRRLTRSHSNATAMSTITTDPATSRVFDRITRSRENCRPTGLNDMMPCGGPPLNQVDVETIHRWIVGGHGDSEGDPHIRTIDGISYDFQGAGEFVLLRGENFEVQTRQTAVETEGPLGANDYTGLSSCVSLNTAAAIRVGPHRITYQPNPNPKNAGALQLRVDGNLVDSMGDRGIVLPSGGRILPTTAPGGLQIQYPGGSEVIITPDFWAHYQLWHLNFAMRNVRANEGIMGNMGPDNWLPALPDGTFLGRRPDDLALRYQDLYEKFADAWRVTPATSLFDYPTGFSTSTFTIDSWPGFAPRTCQVPRDPDGGGGPVQPPLRPVAFDAARQQCAAVVDTNRRTNCEFDVMVTGETSFAKTYLLTEQVLRNAKPIAPELLFPEDDKLDTATTVSFDWKRALDPEGNNLRYMHCIWPAGQFQTFNQCVDLPTQMGMFVGLDRFSRCWWLIVILILCLVVVIILYVKKRRILLLVIAIVVLIAIVLVVYFCRRGNNLSRTVSGLQQGKAYYWKVIVEDGKGGTTESVTRRFAVK